jgi:HSP20 family protein
MNVIPWRRRDGGQSAFRSELEELFGRFFEPFESEYSNRLPATFQQRRFPPLNLSESENELCITLDLPGMEEKDINVELMGNQLVISGERKWEDEEKKGKEFHRVESQYGSFQRALMLPDGLRLEEDAVEANFEKGILEIRIPKAKPTPAARIQVKSGRAREESDSGRRSPKM